MLEHLNPRGARVAALEMPGDVERSPCYFQRQVAHLPTAGEIVRFDRSGYHGSGGQRRAPLNAGQAQEFTPQAQALGRGRPGLRGSG